MAAIHWSVAAVLWMAAVPAAFSKEALPAQAVEQGAGKWWGTLLVKNTGPDADAKPNKCVLGCGMLWTERGCNASKQAGHIIGDDRSVKPCSKATDDARRLDLDRSGVVLRAIRRDRHPPG